MQVEGEYRIDSRIVASGLDLQHESFMKTLSVYQTQLEHFGILRFEIGVKEGNRGGEPPKYCMLNRNQVLFAITLSRNTEAVIEWKMALIDALDQLEKQVGQRPRLARTKLAPASEEEVRVKVTKWVLAFLQR